MKWPHHINFIYTHIHFALQLLAFQHGGTYTEICRKFGSDEVFSIGFNNICCHCTDIPTLRVRAEVPADNTSIRVSWQWSRDGLLMCVDLVRVYYRPKEGSPMMYTVNSTTAISATLPNLQCNTKYTVWVHAYSGGGQSGKRSVSRMVSLPARGVYMLCNLPPSSVNCS